MLSPTHGLVDVSARPRCSRVLQEVGSDYYNLFESPFNNPPFFIQTVVFDSIDLTSLQLPRPTDIESAVRIQTFLSLNQVATSTEITSAVLQAGLYLVYEPKLLILVNMDHINIASALISLNLGVIGSKIVTQANVNADSRLSQLHVGQFPWRILGLLMVGKDVRVIDYFRTQYVWEIAALNNFNATVAGGK